MSHTKENWRVTELDRVIADRMEKVNDDYFIADCFGPDAKENARRIVACVNFCEGVSRETLESSRCGEYQQVLLKERDTYRDLCAELLRALQDAQNTLAHCKAGIGYQHRQADTAIKINSAITKAESILGDSNAT